MIDLVRNAADRKQVRNASHKEKDLRERELEDLRAVLKSVEGRRLLWRLMGWSGFLANPSHQRGDMTQQNIGRGDVGRFVLSEIMDANQEAYLLMQREAWEADRRQKVEAEAIRTRTADNSDAQTEDSES